MTHLYQRVDLHILSKPHVIIILPPLAQHCTSGILRFHLCVHMHHTGSQENEVEPKEQEETPMQGLLEGLEPEGELQECTFERGKP